MDLPVLSVILQVIITFQALAVQFVLSALEIIYQPLEMPVRVVRQLLLVAISVLMDLPVPSVMLQMDITYQDHLA